MRGMRILISLLAGAAAVASVQATAATITYTLSGAFSGNLNNNPVNDFNATFTGIGDTDDAFQVDSFTSVVPLSSLTFDFSDVTYTLLGQNVFFVNRGVPVGGFTDANGRDDKTVFFSPSFASFDGVSTVTGFTGEAPNSEGVSFLFQTDKGQFSLESVTDISFSASVAAVPEPATWAMMLIGFGMIGGASRYGRKRTTVAYA